MIATLQSCYRPVEDCLDPEATNYLLTADDPCIDCCVYPVISLNVFHLNGDVTFNLGDTITNNIGQQVVLLDYAYLLSQFTVDTPEGAIKVEDSISIATIAGTETITDDIIKVDRGAFSYDVGTAIYEGSSTSLTFAVGLPDAINGNPDNLISPPEDHPLVVDIDTLYDDIDEQFVFQRIQVAPGPDFTDTIIYDITDVAPILVEVSAPSERGQDKSIGIEAKYDLWFTDIDFTALTEEEILERILANTREVFCPRE